MAMASVALSQLGVVTVVTDLWRRRQKAVVAVVSAERAAGR